MEDTINITTKIKEGKHKKLKELAKDRSLPLHQLVEELLNWGAEQDAISLYKLGVRVPLFPEDETSVNNNK